MSDHSFPEDGSSGQKHGPPHYIWSRNMRFPADTLQLSPKRRALLRDGKYEATEFHAAKTIVQPDDVVVELGAGIGFISTALATRMDVREVHAFEANPALIPYIKSVYAANSAKSVRLYNAVLDCESGAPVDFYLRPDFVASSRIKPAGNAAEAIKVERISAKAVFEHVKASVLICDIEGGEADLLPFVDFTGLRAVIVELHPKQISSGDIRAIFDAMHRQGLIYFPTASSGKVVAFVRN